MQKASKLYIIGIGFKPLDKRASKIVNEADFIVTFNRGLDVFKGYKEFDLVKDKILSINTVSGIINFIKEKISDPKTQNIVLFGSGDPLFHGIGRRMIDEFGKNMIEIIPDISSIQLAFASIKESWDDALLLSLHGISDPPGQVNKISLSKLPSFLLKHKKIALLTDNQNNPASIAELILNALPEIYSSSYQIFVCEKLGYPDERITQGSPAEIAEMEFSDPNLVILKRDKDIDKTPIFGLKEDEFQHSKGLITKDEVRAVSIHKLRLPEKGVFWDIGAGSGSISVEVAKLSPELSVYAIEKNENEINNIEQNKIKFTINNLTIIKGEAPDCLEELSVPQRVFIGGSDGKIKEIIAILKQKIQSGIVVLNATTIETLNQSIESLESAGFQVEIVQISISRAKSLAGKRHLSALNPIFIITGVMNE